MKTDGEIREELLEMIEVLLRQVRIPRSAHVDWHRYQEIQKRFKEIRAERVIDGPTLKVPVRPIGEPMTKRETIAMHAMQGLLAWDAQFSSPDFFARSAVGFADALLAELEKSRREETAS